MQPLLNVWEPSKYHKNKLSLVTESDEPKLAFLWNQEGEITS